MWIIIHFNCVQKSFNMQISLFHCWGFQLWWLAIFIFCLTCKTTVPYLFMSSFHFFSVEEFFIGFLHWSLVNPCCIRLRRPHSYLFVTVISRVSYIPSVIFPVNFLVRLHWEVPFSITSHVWVILPPHPVPGYFCAYLNQWCNLELRWFQFVLHNKLAPAKIC